MKVVPPALFAATALAAAAFAFAFFPTQTRVIAKRIDINNKELIAEGRYVAIASDCVACHSPNPAKPFSGGYPFASPIGSFYSTNITPDKETGIGNFTLEQFDRAVRYGIRPDGGTLAPAMPYPSYAHLTDEDVTALYAYFMHGVTPVRTDPVSEPPMRWPLAFWRKLFAPNPDRVAPDPSRYADAKIARGAYLVQGAGHCGACHTPRAVTLQEKALDESGADFLAGGSVLDGWVAVDLRGNEAGGLGLWSEQDIVDTLRTGRNAHAAVVGVPMSLVTEHSVQYMSDADLHAIAGYLKMLLPSPGSGMSFASNGATAKALQAGINDSRAAELYVDNCTGCHRSDAQGYAGVFPAIAGNPTVLSADPHSLVRLVLGGSALPATQTRPSELGMPGFAWRLNDDEVAQLVTYIRSQWGNKAPPAKAELVKDVRNDLAQAGKRN